ncbi:hypothetical protein HK102_002276 [Quaeritorhiza haematococci]|nr:hypothetical protein HK102_002276 [Quaeritorhiza haematococci]
MAINVLGNLCVKLGPSKGQVVHKTVFPVFIENLRIGLSAASAEDGTLDYGMVKASYKHRINKAHRAMQRCKTVGAGDPKRRRQHIRTNKGKWFQI